MIAKQAKVVILATTGIKAIKTNEATINSLNSGLIIAPNVN